MTFARILDGPWPIPSSRAGPPYRMLPNEIRSGTPSVVRMLIGRSQTLPSLLLPHSRSVSNSLRRREPGFAPRMHGCGRRLPRCRRSPRLSAGTILARVAAAKSSRSAASIERLPGSPYRACCKEGTPQTGATSSFSNPSRDAYPLQNVPAGVIETAQRAARLVGDGLYGVDLKQQGARTCVIEVNANPDIDSECEAALPASRVWLRLADWFAQRFQSGGSDCIVPHGRVA